MQEPTHLRQIITKDTQDRWVVSLITWIRPGDLPGIEIEVCHMPEIVPHNVVRCDLSGVEINDLVESPFRRDEKLPSATERYLAIPDHKTESFIILGIKHRSVAVRNCQARRNGILQYKIMKTINFAKDFQFLGIKLCNIHTF